MTSNAIKFYSALVIMASSFTLVGCAVNRLAEKPAPQIVYKTKVVDTACQWSKVISVSKDDKMTQQTWEELLAHNKEWVKRCGTPKK